MPSECYSAMWDWGGGSGMSNWSLAGYEKGTARLPLARTTCACDKPQRLGYPSQEQASTYSPKKKRRLARSSLSRSSSVTCFALKTSATPLKNKGNHFHINYSGAHIYVIVIACTVISMRKVLCCARLCNRRERSDHRRSKDKNNTRGRTALSIPPTLQNYIRSSCIGLFVKEYQAW